MEGVRGDGCESFVVVTETSLTNMDRNNRVHDRVVSAVYLSTCVDGRKMSELRETIILSFMARAAAGESERVALSHDGSVYWQSCWSHCVEHEGGKARQQGTRSSEGGGTHVWH